MSKEIEDTSKKDSIDLHDGYHANEVIIEGYAQKEPEFHHSTHGENIYRFMVKVPRLNKDAYDLLPVEVSERAVDISDIKAGGLIRVTGQFRSFNKMNSDTKKVSLSLSIFARDVTDIDEEEKDCRYENHIHLEGRICKDPIFRVTPNGREIGDIILAVQRVYGRNDYIPCIAWSRNARYITGLPVNTVLSLDGRIQSRRYRKRVSDEPDGYITKTVYEVSISGINEVEKAEDAEESAENE